MSKALEAHIARRELLNTIDIRLVARAMSGVENQDGDPTKWKLPNGSNFWFKPHTQGWKDLNQDQGGQGPVRLVRHVYGFEREREAMDWLSERFTEEGGLREGVTADATFFAPREEKVFRAPSPSERNTQEVVDYLVGERGIPPSLVLAEIKAGRLYATRRDVSHDKVGVHEVDENGELIEEPASTGPGHARDPSREEWKTHCAFVSRTAGELRCVEKDGFKGTVPGSQSDSSGYSVPHQKAVAERLVAVVEAAVDAQSYNALFPGRYTLSTNGAYRFALHFKTALEALARPGFGFRLAFDADDAGDLAAQRVFNAFYASKAIAHHFQLDVEDVEAWFINGDLKVDPDVSPHTLFFGNGTGYADALPVHAKHVDKWTDEEGKPHIKTRWEPSGEQSKPSVIVRVATPVGPFEKAGEVKKFQVSPRMYEYVVNDLDVRRDRPMHAKDWNDELRRLGVAYVRDYERCAAAGFKQMPVLPPVLEALRDRTPIVIAPPPAPSSPLPPGRPTGEPTASPLASSTAATPTPAPTASVRAPLRFHRTPPPTPPAASAEPEVAQRFDRRGRRP